MFMEIIQSIGHNWGDVRASEVSVRFCCGYRVGSRWANKSRNIPHLTLSRIMKIISSNASVPKSRKLVIWNLDDDSPGCSPRVPPGSSGLVSPRIRQSFVGNSTKTRKSNMADNQHVDRKIRVLSALKVRSKLNLYFIKSH